MLPEAGLMPCGPTIDAPRERNLRAQPTQNPEARKKAGRLESPP